MHCLSANWLIFHLIYVLQGPRYHRIFCHGYLHLQPHQKQVNWSRTNCQGQAIYKLMLLSLTWIFFMELLVSLTAKYVMDNYPQKHQKGHRKDQNTYNYLPPRRRTGREILQHPHPPIFKY